MTAGSPGGRCCCGKLAPRPPRPWPAGGCCSWLRADADTNTTAMSIAPAIQMYLIDDLRSRLRSPCQLGREGSPAELQALGHFFDGIRPVGHVVFHLDRCRERVFLFLHHLKDFLNR